MAIFRGLIYCLEGDEHSNVKRKIWMLIFESRDGQKEIKLWLKLGKIKSKNVNNFYDVQSIEIITRG